MKMFLASFLQPENFGPGRVFGIVNGGSKPNCKVEGIFEPLTPAADLIESYNKMRTKNPEEASNTFISKYKEQLDNFYVEAKDAAGEDAIETVMPFQDGDTLASWERAEFTNYRKILAPYLEKMGFEVVLK